MIDGPRVARLAFLAWLVVVLGAVANHYLPTDTAPPRDSLRPPTPAEVAKMERELEEQRRIVDSLRRRFDSLNRVHDAPSW